MAAPAIVTPLWQLRSVQNWAKTTLIKELCPTSEANVVQIGGAGIDTGKWERASIAFLLDIQHDESSSREAESRWIQKKSPFIAKFVQIDIERDFRTVSEIVPELGKFSMILSTDTVLEKKLFRSSQDLKSILENVSALLAPEGFFAGICFDSSELWTRLVKGGGSKSYFHTQNNLIKVEFKNMSQWFGQDPSLFYPSKEISFQEWIKKSPSLGIEVSINMEQKSESFYVIHTPTFIEAAKAVGLRMLSFRSLADFYDTFKQREDDQLKTMGVISKEKPRLLPEQRDSMSLYSVFVFQKEKI